MTWPMVALGEVANVNWGDTSTTKKSYSDEGFTAYSASGPDGFLPYADFERDGIVLSAIGARCGKTWLASGKWSCIKNTIRFWSTSDKLDNEYLYWRTRNENFFPKRGAAQPFITIGDARAVEIPLPPLDEQKRIAGILDRADALRRKRRDALALLDTLTQSIFVEMFGDAANASRRFPKTTLGEIEVFLTSGSRGWAKYYSDDGPAFLRIQNLVKGFVDDRDLAHVTPPQNAEAKRTLVQEGDLLISITADLGRVAVVPKRHAINAHINQHIALFRMSEVMSPEFVAAYLATSAGQRQFQALNREGVKAGLNFTDIRSLEISKPSLDEQRRFVMAAKRVREQSEVMADEAATLDSLFASLQSRAFSGRL